MSKIVNKINVGTGSKYRQYMGESSWSPGGLLGEMVNYHLHLFLEMINSPETGAAHLDTGF